MRSEQYLELLGVLRQSAPADQHSMVDAEIAHVRSVGDSEHWHHRGHAIGSYLDKSPVRASLTQSEAIEEIERSEVNLAARRPHWGPDRVAFFDGEEMKLYVGNDLALLSAEDKGAGDWELYTTPWIIFQ